MSIRVVTEPVRDGAGRCVQTFFALDGCPLDGQGQRPGMAVWLHRSLRVGRFTIPLPDREVFVPRSLFDDLLPKA